jgi:hypothetical protein
LIDDCRRFHFGLPSVDQSFGQTNARHHLFLVSNESSIHYAEKALLITA